MRKIRYWIVMISVILLVGIFVTYQALQEETSRTVGPEASKEDQQPNATGVDPVIQSVSANTEQVSLYEKLELSIELQAQFDNPYDPEELDLNAEFQSPNSKVWHINGFYDGAAWKLRFSPNEVGEWKYRISVADKIGKADDKWRSFEAVASGHHGWIEPSEKNPRFLAYDDGASFYGVGVAFPWATTQAGLERIVSHGGNLVTYWNGNYDNAGAQGGGDDQLESLESGIGRYDLMKGKRIDELVEQFETLGIHMNFVVWPHDSLADNINWPATWDKNAYSQLGKAKDFYADEEMWGYQEKLYRYIIARWGYSRAIGIWDLICEINGTDGWELGDKKKANEWITKVHRYFKENDPYGHPTMGSMAGGLGDFWEHGYETLDIADRENYYDLHFSAYAADIRKRWEAYEKPLFIGESGNVTDVAVYHNAIWASLSNGLASAPIWWDMGKMNEEMFGQMRHFSSFVKELDFLERREPVELTASSVRQTLNAVVTLEDGSDATDWSIPDWADANKDANGTLYKAEAEGDAIRTQMLFRTGAYAQGVAQQSVAATDWSVYDEFTFDVYVEHAGKETIKARPVLFPGGQWTEGDDKSDVTLKSGKWATVTVPLHDAPSKYWRDAQLTEDSLKNIVQWGVKLYVGNSKEDAAPTVVKIRSPRLISDQPPVVTLKAAHGWVMKGDSASYGWLVTESGDIAGKSLAMNGLANGNVTIEWFDTWSGRWIAKTEAEVVGGTLQLSAPDEAKSPDIALMIRR